MCVPRGHPQCPIFADYYAAYAGSPCALMLATRAYEAALRDFWTWEGERLRQTLAIASAPPGLLGPSCRVVPV